MQSPFCPPSYTASECAHYCKQNPGICRPSNEVPEPDVFGLLLIGGLVAWAVKRFKR